MAVTHTQTVAHNAVSLTAGGADQNGSEVDLSGGIAASFDAKLTNGATGPTVPAQIQPQSSPDTGTTWINIGGPLVGKTSNNGVSQWGGVPIPPGVKRVRFVAGSNTAQAVTCYVSVVKVTP